MKKATRKSGFTLIEILIVVVIMAVLAATIIPQFSSSVEDSKQSSIDFSLHTLKSQIELYKIQHLGKVPDAITVGVLLQLTQKTNQTGTVDVNGAYGPYLLEGMPVNPLTQTNTVVAATSASDASLDDAGWGYDTATGAIFPGRVGTP